MFMLIAFLNKLVSLIYSRCTFNTNLPNSAHNNMQVKPLYFFIHIITQEGRRVLRLVPRDRRGSRDLFLDLKL